MVWLLLSLLLALRTAGPCRAGTVADDLERVAQLWREHLLTDVEYIAAKAQIIASFHALDADGDGTLCAREVQSGVLRVQSGAERLLPGQQARLLEVESFMARCERSRLGGTHICR